MKIFNYILVGGILILTQCQDASNLSSIPSVKVDVTENKEGKTSDYFTCSEIIVLETCENSLISSIDRLIRTENNIYILDKSRKQIFIFDHHGKFIKALNHRGRAPGEYIQIVDAGVDTLNKQIIVMADIPMCILYYDLQGNFIKQKPLPHLLDNIICENGKEFFYNTYYKEDKKKDYYIWFSEVLDCRKELPLQKNNNFFLKGPRIINSSGILFTKRYDNTVFSLKNDTITPEIRFDFGENNIPPHLKENLNDKKFYLECMQKKICHSVSYLRNNERFITFKTNFGGFIIYDKPENKASYFKYMKDEESGLIFSTYFPHDGADNRMLFTMNANQFLDLFYNLTSVREANNEFIQNLGTILKEDDNPILFFYKFKT